MSCTAKSELTMPDSNRSSSSPSPGTRAERRMNSRSERLISVLSIVVEPLACLASQVPGVHELAQQRAAAVLGIAEAFVEHVERAHHRVQADQVRGLERAHLVAEALLEDLVDLGRGRDAVLQDEGRLVHE